MLKFEVVDVRKVAGDSIMRAFVDVKFGDVMVMKGFTVVKANKGLTVLMPRKPSRDGRWIDQITILDPAFQEKLVQDILLAYKKEVA